MKCYYAPCQELAQSEYQGHISMP